MRPEDVQAPIVGLWPENWPPVQLFLRYSTQWRVGMNGATGLDYNPILHDLDRRHLADDAYDDFMDCIRVIESAALDEMGKNHG